MINADTCMNKNMKKKLYNWNSQAKKYYRQRRAKMTPKSTLAPHIGCTWLRMAESEPGRHEGRVYDRLCRAQETPEETGMRYLYLHID